MMNNNFPVFFNTIATFAKQNEPAKSAQIHSKNAQIHRKVRKSGFLYFFTFLKLMAFVKFTWVDGLPSA